MSVQQKGVEEMRQHLGKLALSLPSVVGWKTSICEIRLSGVTGEG